MSDRPLDPQALRDSVRNVEAGGFVAFEGWVRNHNEGKTVERLEYEAYEAVAVSEGNAILADAMERFGLLEAKCVHRVGTLELEDMAVWVGVSAAHRGEAFDACRFIIDSVKHRLPIWKKEHYTDGDSGWVNCEHCAHAGVALEHANHHHGASSTATPQPTPGPSQEGNSGPAFGDSVAKATPNDTAVVSSKIQDETCKTPLLGGAGGGLNSNNAPTPAAITEAGYYARQIHLKEIGQAGQDKLRQARVFVVGAGGLGSPALQYLAAAGIGHLAICEADSLEASNLHRQTLFDAPGVGQPKALLAAERLRALNPFIDVVTLTDRITRANAVDLVRDYDVLVDCTDNFETKFLLNDVSVLHKKLLVQSSIYQYEGQLFVYNPDHDGPCVRCLWPEMPKPGCVGSCAEVGVLGAIPGVFGSLQAMEVLKHLLDLPDKLQGDTFFMDLLSLRSYKAKAERNHDCPVCGTHPSITAIVAEAPVELDAADLGGDWSGYALIDIRDEEEADGERVPIPFAAHRPAKDIQVDALDIDVPEPWLLVCSRGMRSKYLAMALRKAGHAQVFSLRGGTKALVSAK